MKEGFCLGDHHPDIVLKIKGNKDPCFIILAHILVGKESEILKISGKSLHFSMRLNKYS